MWKIIQTSLKCPMQYNYKTTLNLLADRSKGSPMILFLSGWVIITRGCRLTVFSSNIIFNILTANVVIVNKFKFLLNIRSLYTSLN